MLFNVVDEYTLESIAVDNEIHAEVFLTFTIIRQSPPQYAANSNSAAAIFAASGRKASSSGAL